MEAGYLKVYGCDAFLPFPFSRVSPFDEVVGSTKRIAAHNEWRANIHLGAKGHKVELSDDVKAIAPDVLRHRVLLTYEAEAESVTSDQVVARVLDAVPSP